MKQRSLSQTQSRFRHLKNIQPLPLLTRQINPQRSIHKSYAQPLSEDQRDIHYHESDVQMIFYPNQFLCAQQFVSKGFQAFSEVMEGNDNWRDQLRLLNRGQSSLVETQLEFNDLQKSKYANTMLAMKYNINCTLLQNQWISKSREQSMPRVKVTKHRKIETSDRPIYERALSHVQKDQVIIQKDESKKRQNRKPITIELIVKNIKIFVSLKSYENTDQNQNESYSVREIINRPNPRESGALTVCDEAVYLYGGMGFNMDSKFYQLSVQDLKWKIINFNNINNDKLTGQYGHTMLSYKNNLVIFGGCIRDKQSIKTNLNDTHLVNPIDRTIKLINVNGNIPDRRRFHAAIILSKYLIIIGGINQNGNYLDSMYQLNLETGYWMKLNCLNLFDKLGIAQHSAFLVCNGRFDGPYAKQHMQSKRIIHYVEEGIFIVGGKIGDTTVNSDLYVVKLGADPLVCKKLLTRGKRPHPCFSGSVSYIEERALAVFVGGKDEEFQVSSEVSVLDVENLIWCTVECYGYTQLNRCFHQSVAIESKIIVFGGYNDNQYSSSEVLVLEMDQHLNMMRAKQMNLKPFNHDEKELKNIPNTIQQEVEPQKQTFALSKFKFSQLKSQNIIQKQQRQKCSQTVSGQNIKNFQSLVNLNEII